MVYLHCQEEMTSKLRVPQRYEGERKMTKSKTKIKVPMKGRHTYVVYGEYGGTFTRYSDALKCAREASKTEEYNFCAEIWIEDCGVWFDRYENGKLIMG